MLQPVEWYHYIAHLFNPSHQLPDLKVGEMYSEVAEISFYTRFDSFFHSPQSKKFRNAVGDLRFYGKMSLTNYITQSIIGAIIYFPFGLYLALYCGYMVSLLIGCFTFLLQVKFCKWWLSKHKQGHWNTFGINEHGWGQINEANKRFLTLLKSFLFYKLY